jgi:hypothetical protein
VPYQLLDWLTLSGGIVRTYMPRHRRPRGDILSRGTNDLSRSGSGGGNAGELNFVFRPIAPDEHALFRHGVCRTLGISEGSAHNEVRGQENSRSQRPRPSCGVPGGILYRSSGDKAKTPSPWAEFLEERTHATGLWEYMLFLADGNGYEPCVFGGCMWRLGAAG